MSIRDELIEIVVSADAAHDIDPRPFPDRIVSAILERFAVVELPEPSTPDGDGQLYYEDGDADLRVDTTGPNGPTAYVHDIEVTADSLRGTATAYLAAARDAEARS